MTKERRMYALFFCFWGAIQSGVFLAISPWLWFDVVVSLIMCVSCLYAAHLIVYGGE